MASSRHFAVSGTQPAQIKMGMSGPEALPSTTVAKVFQETVAKHGRKPALCVKRGGVWVKWTFQQYWDDCQAAAKSFIRLGLEPFYAVAILGFNSPEWFIADVGAILAGGFAAGIYTTNNPAACQYVADHARAQFIVVENDMQLKKILQVREQLPHLKKIIQYSGDVSEAGKEAGVLSWTDFMMVGTTVPDYELRWRIDAQQPGHCCTLIYTSGTTGNPKAVMISHDNITWTSRIATSLLKLGRKDHLISYLPLSHIAAQMIDIHGPMLNGCTTWFAEPDALKGSLVLMMREVRPTVFLGVPRVWEKIHEKMAEVGAQTTGLKKKIAIWAKRKGSLAGHARIEGRSLPFGYTLAKALVYKKVRKNLGLDRCHHQASAAAPISKDILEYFLSLDIPIMEIYGMSECTGPQTISVSGKHRIGSTGVSIPGTEIKIDPVNHEICYRGRHVFMGYLFNEEKTKEAIDPDGWLLSGDVGEVDERGFLHITGRIKELLITAGGENVAPVPIEENIMRELPILANCMVIGDRRKFLAALLCLRTDADPNTTMPLPTLAASIAPILAEIGSTAKTVDEARADEKVSKYLQAGIDRANKAAVSNAQVVQKFYVLPQDFSIPGGELGPTLKLRRGIVDQKYKDTIDALYA